MQCSNRGTEFSPSLEETREIIVACLQQIVLCTKEFPRIEQELLPEMKGRPNLHLLSVGWEEDRVQDLMKKVLLLTLFVTVFMCECDTFQASVSDK